MWILDLNFGKILREFGEILGKYRILNGRSVRSKGLNVISGYVNAKCHAMFILVPPLELCITEYLINIKEGLY